MVVCCVRSHGQLYVCNTSLCSGGDVFPVVVHLYGLPLIRSNVINFTLSCRGRIIYNARHGVGGTTLWQPLLLYRTATSHRRSSVPDTLGKKSFRWVVDINSFFLLVCLLDDITVLQMSTVEFVFYIRTIK